MSAFNDALDCARQGSSSIVMVAGPPGIGKTRTAQQMAGKAAVQDTLVLWAGCLEEPGAPPYWPWLRMLRTYINGQDAEVVRVSLGDACRQMAGLDPTLAPLLSFPWSPECQSPSPPLDAAPARFQLFDAIAGVWQRIATRQPLLLIFDDLQCADVATLKLLEHVALECSTTRIMLLGTYRDSEVTRCHPLSDTLSALTRYGRLTRLRLSGFSEHETAAFVAAVRGAPSLAQSLHERTEGHPLFLAEVTRLLEDWPGAVGSVPSFDPQRVPAGVREVIGSRLNRLSAQCNHALGNAAVIGRQFDYALLTALLETLTEDQCLAVLDEAIGASLIEALPEPAVYRFTHMLIRDVLYEEMPAPRRMRLHQQIGTTIEEQHRHDLRPWLSVLAYHFHAARTAGTSIKAVDYAIRAAKQADSGLAYEEAARLYTLALDAIPATRQDDRCELFLALGDVRSKMASHDAALENFAEAAEIARQTGSPVTLARAAMGYELASWRTNGSGTASVVLLKDALAANAPGDCAQRARLLAALARALVYADHANSAVAIHQQAVSMARRLGDTVALFAALSAIVPARRSKVPLALRLDAGREAMRLAERAGMQEWALAVMLLEKQQQGSIESESSLLDAVLSACLERGMWAVEQRALALQQTASRTGRPSYPAGLTEREVQVLRMIAAGRTNQDIAKALFRSANTVASHVRNILSKVNAANRTEAAAFAVRHKLLAP